MLDAMLDDVERREIDHVGDDARIRAARGTDRLAISSAAGLALIGDRSMQTTRRPS